MVSIKAGEEDTIDARLLYHYTMGMHRRSWVTTCTKGRVFDAICILSTDGIDSVQLHADYSDIAEGQCRISVAWKYNT